MHEADPTNDYTRLRPAKASMKFGIFLIQAIVSGAAAAADPDLVVLSDGPGRAGSLTGIVRWTGPVDGEMARAFAVATGGELVSISDAKANEHLRCLRAAAALGLGPCDGPWIGLSRIAATGDGASWTWRDLTPVTFIRWADGAPTTSTRITAFAAMLEDGTWLDSLPSPDAGTEIRSAAVAWPGTSDADLDGIPDALTAFGIATVLVPARSCGTDPADLDGNGRVDSADLAIVLAGWGGTDDLPDINDDGRVDHLDLGMLLAAWTGP
jgi:hypothetical protein